MSLLKEQIAAHRIVLHTTDITMLEVKRQIHEQVLARQRELNAIEKDFRRWRKSAPKAAPGGPLEFDADLLAADLFKQFEHFLSRECNVKVHQALQIAPQAIFERYFTRKPPFDSEDSKEFPDAFVIVALADWCQQHGNQAYVVTQDKAMMRAAAAERLLSLKDIQEVLARAAADLDSAGEAIAEGVLNHPAFDQSLEDFLNSQMTEMVYVYAGDLADGEAYEGELVSIGDRRLVSGRSE